MEKNELFLPNSRNNTELSVPLPNALPAFMQDLSGIQKSSGNLSVIAISALCGFSIPLTLELL